MIDSKGWDRRGVITTRWRVSNIGVADPFADTAGLVMDADVDTLATALYVKIDQLLIDPPHRASWRPRVGIAPRISDAELLTLCVMQALLGFTCEARWVRHAHAHLRHLFPYLPPLSPGRRGLAIGAANTTNSRDVAALPGKHRDLGSSAPPCW